MHPQPVAIMQEISRVLLLIMYALLAKTINGYHYVKETYLKYKYTTDEVKPTCRYFLDENGDEHNVLSNDRFVPEDWVYIEEWNDIKGRKKNIVKYESDSIPCEWKESPFDMPPAKCPWVWVGDKDTEIDLTRCFDKFLVPGNVIKEELVSRFVNNSKTLSYIEIQTFKHIKFPGDGITIVAYVV